MSHGLPSLAQQLRVAPQRRLECGNIFDRVPDAPYEVVRVSFHGKSIACVQKMSSHGWVSSELGVRTDKHDRFSLAFPPGDIEVLRVFFVHTARVGAGSDTRIICFVASGGP